MTRTATEIVTRIVAAPDGTTFADRQVIDREPIQYDFERDLSSLTLNADDLGTEPGTVYEVSLVDANDDVIESREVVAL